MRHISFLRAVVASTILAAFSVMARAQSEPQEIRKPTAARSQKLVSKPHKVWTDDNLSTVRTPADTYIEVKERQAAINESALAQTVPEKLPAAGSEKPPAVPPLAHAKSLDDANFKIEWEKRDVQGQEEYIARLQEQLDQSPQEQKEHIQKLIERHKQFLADTRSELKGLEDQKKDFQQNPADKAAAPHPKPPSP